MTPDEAAARVGEIAAVYESLGRVIGAPAANVALVENATVAWNQPGTASAR